jgi:hypothetical protein
MLGGKRRCMIFTIVIIVVIIVALGTNIEHLYQDPSPVKIFFRVQWLHFLEPRTSTFGVFGSRLTLLHHVIM